MHLDMYLYASIAIAWNYFNIHDINQNARAYYRWFKCPNLIIWDLLHSDISIMFSFIFWECSKQLIMWDILNFSCNVQNVKRND